MRYEFWVGARYAGLGWGARRAKQGDRFVSFIAGSSMVGIALGVAALIVVLSVVNGFQPQGRVRRLSVLRHRGVFWHGSEGLQARPLGAVVPGVAKQETPAVGAAPLG